MPEFKEILFPVDLSDIAPKIVPYVQTFTETFKARLHLLFAARVMGQYTGLYVPTAAVTSFEQSIIEGAHRKLKEFKEENFPTVQRIQLAVRSGDPSEEILAYISEQNIDMVVMGTHGRKGLDRVLFGSVAERVVKLSSAPVFTVNPFRGRESA
ncbi:MAG: universal stress protein [Desulfobacterales bacterium]